MADTNELSNRINALKSDNDKLRLRIEEVRGSANRGIEELKNEFDDNVRQIKYKYENALNIRSAELEQEYKSLLESYKNNLAKKYSESISSIQATLNDFIENSEKKVDDAVELSKRYKEAAEDLLRNEEMRRGEEAERSKDIINTAFEQLEILKKLPICFLAPGEIESFSGTIKKAVDLYNEEQYPSAGALADSCTVSMKRQITSIVQQKKRWQNHYERLKNSFSEAEGKIKEIEKVYSQKKNDIGTQDTEMMDWCFDRSYTQSEKNKEEYKRYLSKLEEVRQKINFIEKDGSVENFLLNLQQKTLSEVNLSEDDLYMYERDITAANGRLDVFRDLIDQNLTRAVERFETIKSISSGMTESGFSIVKDFGGIYDPKSPQVDHRRGVSVSFVRNIDDVTADICIISDIDSRNVYSENVFFAADQEGSYNLVLQENEIAEIIEKRIGKTSYHIRHDPLVSNMHKEMLDENKRIINARVRKGTTES